MVCRYIGSPELATVRVASYLIQQISPLWIEVARGRYTVHAA